MLADQLLDPTQDWDVMAAGMAGYRRTLHDAQKFVIDRELAQVIDAMPRRDIGLAMPFCRLPYPVCWIECVHLDRPKFAAVGCDPSHYMPVRVGLLCEQDGDDPQTFWATLAWSLKPSDTRRNNDLCPLSVCVQGLWVDCSRPGHWEANDRHPAYDAPFVADPVVAPYWRDLIGLMDTRGLNELARNAENDWKGEIWFWLGALALVNARNGVASESRPAPPRLNRARQKAGKLPLVDYHQLTLRVGPRARAEAREAGPGGHMRAHTVRGHFKVRKTGIFWWSHFLRGDLAEGFAGKRYKVKL